MIDISQWRTSIGLWYYQICDNVIDKSLPALCRKGTRAKKQSSNEKHSQTNMNGTAVEQISSNEIPQYRANRRNRYSNPVLVVSNGQTPVVSINGQKLQNVVALSNGLISNNNQKTVPSTDGKTVVSTNDQTSVVLSSGQTSTNGKKQVALFDSQTPVPFTDGKTPVVSSDSQKQVALSNGQTPVVYSNSRLTSKGQKPLLNSQTPVTSTDGQTLVVYSDNMKPVALSNGQTPPVLSTSGQKPVVYSDSQKPVLSTDGQKPVSSTTVSTIGQTPVVYCNSQKPVALSSKGQKPVASSNNQEPVALSYCPNVRCSVGQTSVDGIYQTSINGQTPVALSNSSTANTTMRYADWSGRVQTISLAVFLFLLLILSGDIELNPGPKTGK